MTGTAVGPAPADLTDAGHIPGSFTDPREGGEDTVSWEDTLPDQRSDPISGARQPGRGGLGAPTTRVR
jgi:hypothetical protein